MLRKTSNSKPASLRSLLLTGILWRCCDTQVKKEATNPPDGRGGDSSAFFALRSCHQLLHGDSGEFFSPDYLCSNPPLWCNWTIRADPGQRIHLHLEDLTPDETCHLKLDQIHVDEPADHVVGHKVLQKCWREVKFTSSSNTLYVVLLIGGWPSPPYRGFFGRYQAFGPLVLYNPGEGVTGSSPDPEPTPEPLSALREYDHVGSDDGEPGRSDVTYDYYEQNLALTAELPWQLEEAEAEAEGQVFENLHSSWEDDRPVHPFTPSVRSSRIIRSGGGVARNRPSQSHSSVHPVSPQQPQDSELYELKSSTLTPTAAPGGWTRAENHSRAQSWTNLRPVNASGQAYGAENTTDVNEAFNQLPPPTQSTEPTHPLPNVVEPLSDRRGRLNMRNHSATPHTPGDHLFEITVEVNFIMDLNKSWDSLSKSLLQSVKALISSQLGALHTLPSLSSKRIKRLHAGALYILWLQIRQGPGDVQVHGAVHSALQGLVSAGAGLRENHRNAVVMSVSIADVNECGTQLVLCDVNAECVNQFGSYSCRCRPGFQDQSRLGSGGTICIEVKAAGCSSGMTSETKGVYVLFFLLSCLILMLLAAAGMFYHRHHRGAFLVRCHSSGSISPHDPNNNHCPNEGFSSPSAPDLPPPPPARGPREGWPPVNDRRPAADLPLLRFSPLLPPDGYMDPHRGGKV